MRTRCGLIVPLFLSLAGFCTAAERTTIASSSTRPNFLFILIDDLRFDAMSCAGSPFLRTPGIDRIASRGVRFANAFVTTSLCSPARASFLTGMYAHSHGVRTNEGEELDPKWPTFPRVLKENGYQTAFVGKWHMGMNDQPRPGFDYWLSFKGQGVYNDPRLNENGREIQAKGYMTDILTQYAVDWLKQSRAEPFCLYLSHKAVHGDFIPADRHKDLFSDFEFPEPPNYRDDYSGKPRWQRVVRIRGGRLKRPAPASIPATLEVKPWSAEQSRLKRRVDYYRTISAVDESVARILDTLNQIGQLENTVVFFAGDNGFFQGEHNGLTDKRWAYEESMRIPLLATGPGIPKGKRIEQMVLNIDVAPSILDLAGLPIPANMQGRSWKPLLAGRPADWRGAFLYEYFREEWLPGVPDMVGVRKRDFKYVRYPGIHDLDELYNLQADPHEMRNLATDPAARDQLAAMKAELKKLSTAYGLPASMRQQTLDDRN